MNPVTAIPAAEPAAAYAHFARRLAVETDPADVHLALQYKDPGFTLLDVRSPQAYADGRLPGAVSLPRPAGQDDDRRVRVLGTRGLAGRKGLTLTRREAARWPA